MNKDTVQDWLDRYGAAWVQGDPDQIIKLFSETAIYRETPFDDAMEGLSAIRKDWQEGAADAQEDVAFSSQVWGVDGYQAFAGWQARFRRKTTGAHVELDGAFRLMFSQQGDALLCTRLDEWWHRRET